MMPAQSGKWMTMRLSILGLAAALLVSNAAAAQSGAACVKMKDAAGCTCALATGGMVSGSSWARGPDRTAFEACLAARGSTPAQTRPATISARP